ncbi:MAG: Uma2 family endonuclease, partial [Firmicutes bacterium]|nr:Uma2 family endonuclease [Bacillota bacterium]
MELNELKRRKDAIGYEYDEIADLAGVEEEVVRRLFEDDPEEIPKDVRLRIESVFNVSPKNGGGMGISYSLPTEFFPSAQPNSTEEKPVSEKRIPVTKKHGSMKLEEMKRRKYELGYTNEMIAEKSGVPLSTVQKIFAGFTLNPRYETRQAIEAVLNESPDKVMETTVTYNAGLGAEKKQGEYTLEDYYDMPEERRVELIDGVIYDMTAPHQVHQRIAMTIWGALETHIQKKAGKCMAFTSPSDVHLMKDDKTMVQPDVFVVCDRNKLTGYTVEGAPDLIVEILSPSTKRKDMTIKLNKYLEAGVREYWLVDPEKKKVIVYLSG